MENRFGFRDFLLCALLTALLVSVWLAMKQYDRQWDELHGIRQTLNEQNVELKRLNQRLASGVQLAGNGQNPADAAGDPSFTRREAAHAMPGYAEGDWLVDAFGADVGKLTPLVASDAYQSTLEGYVLDSLAERDPETLEWKPMVARMWDVSPDGLTIRFELRDDVRFSDGSPLTAADVVFTYQWIMNPKVAAVRTRSYYEKITQVEQQGDYAVVFHLSEPYFKGFEVCAGLAILSKQYYSQFSEEQFNELPGLLFGSGPYRLPGNPQDWQPGEGKVELVRNDRYWGVKPALERLVFRIITDDTARLVAFRNGETDRYSPTPENYLALKDDQQLRQDKEMYEYETITGGYRYIAWNQQRAGKPTRFADRRVRQALTLLTNRKQMCQTLMVGLATPNSGPFHRLSKQANPDIQPWPYDPDAARKLLKEAGFEDRNGDGVIESADGVPFQFKLIYPASSTNYQQMALYLKDAYARAGIAMEPDPLEWTIMLQRIDQRDFDAMTLGWTGVIEADPYQIFHSKQIGDGGDNYTAYRNPQLDELIDKARVTMDEDARLALWRQVHAILHEDQPYTFLWTSRAVLFIDKRIHNVQRLPLGLNSNTEWFVPLAQQRWTNK